MTRIAAHPEWVALALALSQLRLERARREADQKK